MRSIFTSRTAEIKVLTGTIVSLLLFSALFSDPFMNFWYQMPLTVAILCGMVWGFEKGHQSYMMKKELREFGIRQLFIAAGSAVVLYGIFYVGNIAARHILHTSDRIAEIYTLKSNNPAWLMALVIALIVGPGEELFWRGFMQRILTEQLGIRGIVITAVLYSMVHVASGNVMLLAAALVCGLFWGLLYWKYKNIYINMISHVIWDLAVFLILPFD